MMINQWTITLIYSTACALLHHNSMRKLSRGNSNRSPFDVLCGWVQILAFWLYFMSERPMEMHLHVFVALTMLGAGLLFEFDEYLKERFEEK